jgi:hypothetical protein
MAVFWVTALCSLVDTDQRLKGAYCLHHQGNDASTDSLLAVRFRPILQVRGQ